MERKISSSGSRSFKTKKESAELSFSVAFFHGSLKDLTTISKVRKNLLAWFYELLVNPTLGSQGGFSWPPTMIIKEAGFLHKTSAKSSRLLTSLFVFS